MTPRQAPVHATTVKVVAVVAVVEEEEEEEEEIHLKANPTLTLSKMTTTTGASQERAVITPEH